jgi:hypothetical protein
MGASGCVLTLAFHAMPVDARAAYHYIVDDGEAALAADPVPLAILQTAVRQDSSLVEAHSSAVLCLCDGQFLWVKELPYRAVDDLVRGMTEDVNDGVRRV